MNKKVNLKLRDLLEEHGMTQKELAELVGVRPQTINAWEKDISSIKAQHLLKLCEILGTTASDLLGV